MKKEIKKDFNNIVSYASTFFLSFKECPLNEIDMAIFSKLAYFNFKNHLSKNYHENVIKNFYNLSYFDDYLKRPAYRKEDFVLLQAICGNPRFNKIIIRNIERTTNILKEEQFSATTFLLENDDIIISYRGTDSTINGWKEDFNMAFMTPIPAQIDAKNYLNKIGRFAKGKIYLTGHSKGGNLAFYSYLNTLKIVQEKIVRVYSFDGPGLDLNYFKDINELTKKAIFKKFIPDQSIIGMIFEKDHALKIVNSDGILLSQHNLYNWHINKTKFERAKNLNKQIHKFNNNVSQWLKSSANNEKELIINTLFQLVNAAGLETSEEIIHNKLKSAKQLFSEYEKLDDTKKTQFKKVVTELIKYLI